MESRKDRIVRFAKQNKWFRSLLISVYTISCALDVLWKKSLSFRKGLTACVTILALCVSRICIVTAAGAGEADQWEELSPDESNEGISVSSAEKDGGIFGLSFEEEGEISEVSMEKDDGNSDIPAGETISGNDPADETISGNDPTGGIGETGIEEPADDELAGKKLQEEEPAEEEQPEEFEYRYTPQLSIAYGMADEKMGLLTGNGSFVITLSTVSSRILPEEEGEAGLSPAVCAYGEADGKMLYADLSTGSADIVLSDDFFGNITFTAEDEMGNTCEETTQMIFIDVAAPTAGLAKTELTDGSTQFMAVFHERGATATGIAKVSCFIDGEAVPSDGFEVSGVAENCFGQGVISDAVLPLDIKQAGQHTVRLEVKDHAGNTSSYVEEITVSERKLVSVSVPSEVKLTINPWKDEEQVYSDIFTIENISGFDIIATIGNVRLTVDREDVGNDAAQKDCSVYLSSDIMEDIALPEGDSGKLWSFRIPAKEEDGETNGSLSLWVHGGISDGSELLWKDGDMNLKLVFDYKAAEKES